MQAEFLTLALKELSETCADIDASGIFTADGLMVTAILSANQDEHKMAAICAVILALSDSATHELGQGSLEQVLIKGSKGAVVMVYIGKDAILAALAKPNADLDQVSTLVKQAAERAIGLID